jgi:hypothetical protein
MPLSILRNNAGTAWAKQIVQRLRRVRYHQLGALSCLLLVCSGMALSWLGGPHRDGETTAGTAVPLFFVTRSRGDASDCPTAASP